MRLLGLFNMALVVGLVAFAFFLYGQEHRTRLAERQIRQVKKEIAREEETIRILRVEWAMLSRPDRLERLARRHLSLKAPDPERIRSREAALAAIPRRKAKPLDGMDAASLAGLIARIQREEVMR